MAAAAGASGTRAWLQAHHLTWLTPKRMKAVTIGLCAVAFVVPSVGFSGSSKPTVVHHPTHRVNAAEVR